MPNLNSIGIKSKLFELPKTLKTRFNFLRLNRKSKDEVAAISENISEAKIMLPVSYKDKNRFAIFRGSLLSTAGPISVIRYIFLMEKKYGPWAKQSEIVIKNPAKENLYASFKCSLDEIMMIRSSIEAKHKVVVPKTLQPTSIDGSTVFCETSKSIYLAITKTTVSESSR